MIEYIEDYTVTYLTRKQADIVIKESPTYKSIIYGQYTTRCKICETYVLHPKQHTVCPSCSAPLNE